MMMQFLPLFIFSSSVDLTFAYVSNIFFDKDLQASAILPSSVNVITALSTFDHKLVTLPYLSLITLLVSPGIPWGTYTMASVELLYLPHLPNRVDFILVL